MTTPKAKFAGLALIATLCVGFTLGLTAPAWAGFDEGLAAYQRGDYSTAIREWRPLAEQGNANAQYNLGVMYERGRGVTQDYAKALQWYRKAAEQGEAYAQINLGNMYDDGRGVPQDYAKALQGNDIRVAIDTHNKYYQDGETPWLEGEKWFTQLLIAFAPPGEYVEDTVEVPVDHGKDFRLPVEPIFP